MQKKDAIKGELALKEYNIKLNVMSYFDESSSCYRIMYSSASELMNIYNILISSGHSEKSILKIHIYRQGYFIV